MGQMELYGISLTKLTVGGAERAEQDQTRSTLDNAAYWHMIIAMKSIAR